MTAQTNLFDGVKSTSRAALNDITNSGQRHRDKERIYNMIKICDTG